VSEATDRDWFQWHRPYDDPDSSLVVRLSLVQSRIRDALDQAPPGEIRLVSLCAGQCRDVIGVLADHPRRDDVRARLVELDGRNVAVARQLGAEIGMAGGGSKLQIVKGDASLSDSYLGIAPTEVVLACGIFGNISDDDIHRTVELLPMLCASGATVIWTRHRREPDLTGEVRRWFAEAGYEEVGFDAPEDHPYVGVGTHRRLGAEGVVEPGVTFFRFV
jgi:hypothetical protein